MSDSGFHTHTRWSHWQHPGLNFWQDWVIGCVVVVEEDWSILICWSNVDSLENDSRSSCTNDWANCLSSWLGLWWTRRCGQVQEDASDRFWLRQSTTVGSSMVKRCQKHNYSSLSQLFKSKYHQQVGKTEVWMVYLVLKYVCVLLILVLVFKPTPRDIQSITGCQRWQGLSMQTKNHRNVFTWSALHDI